ncbi:MAG: hypothetical protein ABIT38_01050 [Gemmatimonadaceae bacterium]
MLKGKFAVRRSIAVDWSGAKEGAEKSIWLAEVISGHVERLEGDRDREELADFLIAERAHDPDLVVGLDFAFSLPRWFLDERAMASAVDLWDLAVTEGESWLLSCEPPFWGRPGKTRPIMSAHFRRADSEVPPVAGIRPKSVFQIGGAGAVGTGSLRGMPILRRLRQAGFSIWPFDEPGSSIVVEIYPRLLTGPVAKSSASARRAYLIEHYPQLDLDDLQKCEASDDAFDALVSALMMDRHYGELRALPRARDEQDLKEGRIWFPAHLSHGVAQREFLVETLKSHEDIKSAMPEVQLSASGVRLFEDFRDNLVVDRFDPQLARMSGAKRNAMHSENSEDALTWNTFRAPRRADPKLWIPQLARRAFEDEELSADAEAHVHLWSRIESPPSIKRFQKDEGASEIDVVIETDAWVWTIEAKLHSDVSLNTKNNGSRDQLLRNLDVGSYYAGVRRFYFSLLTLDDERSPEGGRLLKRYQNDLTELRGALPHRADGLRNLMKIGQLAWSDVRNALRDVGRHSAEEDASVAATLALAWLAERVPMGED